MLVQAIQERNIKLEAQAAEMGKFTKLSADHTQVLLMRAECLLQPHVLCRCFVTIWPRLPG